MVQDKEASVAVSAFSFCANRMVHIWPLFFFFFVKLV